jgi:hypothetical protein
MNAEVGFESLYTLIPKREEILLIALIENRKQMAALVNYTAHFSVLEELLEEDLHKFDFIFINGKGSDEPLKMSYKIIEKLWRFVEQGGVLYGEFINCEDFPSSRLFGFKQEFPATNRRLEKIRVAIHSNFCRKGQLLEWQGPFLSGFAFDSDTLLDIGNFKETHETEQKGDYPGIVVKNHGKGKTIFSTFSFLSNDQLWTLRPHWLWNQIVKWLQTEFRLPIKTIHPIIQISMEKDVKKTIERGINWFFQSGIMPKEDGSSGVYENVHSIRSDISKDFRPDCNAHTALMFYLYGQYTKEERWLRISQNLFAYLFKEGYQDLDPASHTYGFWKWFRFPKDKPDQIFSDDNGWIAFILLYLYRKTGYEEYKKRGLLTAYSLLKTQNQNGLRPEAIREKELFEKGIPYFRQLAESSMNPHFESIVHAAFIQAYLVSKDEAFLQTAIRGTMHLLQNKEKMKFLYSKTAGYSRFLFSLSLLYALTKDKAIREGLYETVHYLMKCQHEMGGVEERDNPDPDRYGAEDTGVFRENGEGIADQLYTNNFLIVNGWEAWKATGDLLIKDFHEKLCQYISMIQISSRKKEFDGGWMRSFHLHKQEYFGNNGDTGWGAYCIESGWTNAMILSGLILKELNQSFLD